MGVGRPLAAAPIATASRAASVVEDEGQGFFGLPICRPPDRFWLRGDYLMWWTSGTRLPALVTTSPQETPSDQAGVLPDATILYGDQTILGHFRSGYRTTLGMWLDSCHTWSLELDYFAPGEGATRFSRTSSGEPILARPFFNLQTAQQASHLAAYPELVEGTIAVAAKDRFQSAGALVGYKLFSNGACGESCDPCGDSCAAACGTSWLCGRRLDLLAGFRYYNLGDRLAIAEDLRITELDSTLHIRDRFRANNDFYGGELGLRSQVYRGRWSLEILAKIALGNTRRVANIDGQTVVTAPDQPTQTYDGGILAVGTNSGAYHRDAFTIIPHLGVELGYRVNDHWRAYVGYEVLYWACVWRAADQIDLDIDPRNFPPPLPGAIPFPAFPGTTSGFWAQGLNVGLEFRF